MKKLLLILAITSQLLIITNLVVAETIVCGSHNSKKFHRLNCKYVKRIIEAYKDYGSPEYFIQRGYTPCNSKRGCHPPTKTEETK
jgi:hypothetical protein